MSKGRISRYIDTVRAQLRWSKNPDKEWVELRIRHNLLFVIRVDLECLEKWCGGLTCRGLDRPSPFQRDLRSGATGMMDPPLPSDEDLSTLRDAWFKDDLYHKILAGDPGPLFDVGMPAVQWFMYLVEDAVCEVDFSYFKIRKLSARQRAWPGYVDDNATWLDG